jgi:hypothetical protein
MFGRHSKLTEDEAKAIAKDNMRAAIRRLRNETSNKDESYSYPSDSYIEGAISAIQDLYKRVKSASV